MKLNEKQTKKNKTSTRPPTSSIKSGKIEQKIKDQIHMAGKETKRNSKSKGSTVSKWKKNRANWWRRHAPLRHSLCYASGLVAPQSTQLPWAVSRLALAQLQQLHNRTLLEVLPCTTWTCRKSALNLLKIKIPGKQISHIWKNFALYLVSTAWDESTGGFNRCGLWKPLTHLSANCRTQHAARIQGHRQVSNLQT